jgi:hypothetical protein
MTSLNPRYHLLLRPVNPQSLVFTTLDSEILKGFSLMNKPKSTINFKGTNLSDNVEQFCQLNGYFDMLCLRMKRRFEDCQTIHCYYLEVYYRLLGSPHTNMRRLRHYVIDHLTILIHTLMQIMFLANGQIIRSEDALETPPHHIHPTLFSCIGKANGEIGNTTGVTSCLTSLKWLVKLRMVLLEEIHERAASASLRKNVKQFDASLASQRENILNWLTATMDMIEVMQLVVRTRLIRGFVHLSVGRNFNMKFVSNDDDKGLQISPITVATKLNLDFKLLNHNIQHKIIEDAVECAIAATVLNDLDYRLIVASLVEQKRLEYEKYTSTLHFTIGVKRANKCHAMIQAAEEGYYTEEKHLLWW